VLYFRWGESDDDEALYLSSADWMSRNMFRRIEVAWPVQRCSHAPARHRRMPGALSARHAKDAWRQRPTATTARCDDGASAQQALMRRSAVN
jgi:polyphosphate kinase